jgi:hypothetical protein
MRYKFPLEADRALVVEALRAAAEQFGTLADHMELDDGEPDCAERVAEYAGYRKKSEECYRLASEIEGDALPRSRRRGDTTLSHFRLVI